MANKLRRSSYSPSKKTEEDTTEKVVKKGRTRKSRRRHRHK